MTTRFCWLLALLVLHTLAAPQASAQPPEHFRWVDLKTDQATVARITDALKSEPYTALREIAILEDHALVFTATREGETTPNGDRGRVFDISLTTSARHELLSAYEVHISDWVRFTNGISDLAVSYSDCWACEPSVIYTAFHFDLQTGWHARWVVDEQNRLMPGIGYLSGEVFDPSDAEEIDQVFAVLQPLGGNASVGTWHHVKDRRTGKVTSRIERYSADPETGADKHEILIGTAADEWARKLCKPGSFTGNELTGQSTKSCRQLLAKRTR